MPFAEPTVLKMLMADQGITSIVVDPMHKIMEHGDHLKAICDWIQTPIGQMSPGDCAIYLAEYIRIAFYSAWFALIAKDYEKTS